jgi:hypothetical protein
MIRRLVEANYFQNCGQPNPAQIRFWFLELRTAELLKELALRYPAGFRRLVPTRPLLGRIAAGETELEQALMSEESAERERDRRYWLPLRAELEQLRHPKLRPAD